jgi:hypothetical protein
MFVADLKPYPFVEGMLTKPLWGGTGSPRQSLHNFQLFSLAVVEKTLLIWAVARKVHTDKKPTTAICQELHD